MTRPTLSNLPNTVNRKARTQREPRPRIAATVPPKIDWSSRDIAPSNATQEIMVALAVFSDAHCEYVRDNIPVSAFGSPHARRIVQAAYDYIDRYHKAPKIHLRNLLEHEVGGDDPKQQLLEIYWEGIGTLIDNGFNDDFAVEQVGGFLRAQNVKALALDVVNLLDGGNVPEAEDKIKREAERIVQRISNLSVSPTPTLREFLRMEIPEQRVLFGPLREESLYLVHAWRGTGKSWFLLNIAYALATGGRYLDWEAPEPIPVLYIDAEMSARMTQDRLRMIHRSDDRKDVDLSNFRIMARGLVSGPMPNLATAEGQDEVDAMVGDAKVIFCDSISSLVRSEHGENEQQSWQQADEWQLMHRRNGRSVVWAHHDNKSGEQRGTSGREDNIDMTIHLKTPTGWTSDSAEVRFEIHFTKNRAGMELGPVREVCGVQRAGNRQEWSFESVKEATRERALELAREGMTKAEIARTLNLNRSTVGRHLNKEPEREYGKRKPNP